MFSRCALRTFSITPLLRKEFQQRALVAVSARGCATQKAIETWDKANKTYYGPERDTTNFPHPTQPESHPPARLGFIPDSWFQAFYEKTGVTGPYVLGAGALTFFISKEMWVVEHGFFEFFTFWLAFYWVAKKFGPAIAKFADQSAEEYREARWEAPMRQARADAQAMIDATEDSVSREEGQKYLFQSKKENVDLQLEAVYRQRLAEVHQAVKKRLDFQLDLENSKRRFEQKHMVNWIVDGVVKSITPQQERESIAKSILTLKNLAAAQPK